METLYPSLLCLRGYPPEIRDRLAEAATSAGVSANDFAVGVLAEIYDVPFTSGTRPLRAMRSGDFAERGEAERMPGSTLQLRLPPELNFRIHEQATRKRALIRDIVLGHLARRLGVAYVRPFIPRGRPRKKVVA